MCEYCRYNDNINKSLVKTYDSNFEGLNASIVNNQLFVSGFYDSFVGIEPINAKINYCPMCGQKLDKDWDKIGLEENHISIIE